MKLEEMSAEELVSYRDDCREFLDEPFRSKENIDSYNDASKELISRLTRGEKAIKAMEDLQCCGNCCYIADRRCPKWYTGMLTEKENENKDDNFPCLGDCIHINETVICRKCGEGNYLYVPFVPDVPD